MTDKTTIKMIIAYLFSVLALRVGTDLIRKCSIDWNIANGGKYEAIIAVELLVLCITIFLFWIMKKADSEIKDLKDAANGSYFDRAAELPEGCAGWKSRTMTIKTFLLLVCCLCLVVGFRDVLNPSYVDADKTQMFGDAHGLTLFLYVLWICITEPLVYGIIHYGLLQTNMEKYGFIYAILVSAIADYISKYGVAMETGAFLFMLFFATISAVFGLRWAILLSVLHQLVAALPSLLQISFELPGMQVIFNTDAIIYDVAVIGMVVAAISLVVWEVRLSRRQKKEEVVYSAMKSLLVTRADAVMTLLGIGGFWTIEKLLNQYSYLLYGLHF